MSRRRLRAPRNRSVRFQPAGAARARAAALIACAIDALESRVLFSAAFNITQLTNMRADPTYSGINGSGIGIAVLDTGVYAQNPDLKNNVVAFYNAVEQPVNAPIDPNFLQDAVDNNGHGSHTSGIAASSNPNIGVAYGAHLVDVKVLNDPGEAGIGGDALDRGLQWVALHASQYNIKVVNMSLGFPGTNQNYPPALDQYGFDIQQLESMGITVVSASGNSYAVYAAPGESDPADESTIGVANSFADNGTPNNYLYYSGEPGDPYWARQTSAAPDILNAGSQRSTLFNQVVAPGTDILSTWNSPSQIYNTESGTSMASPFVAGTVALMQQAAQQFGGTYLQPSQVLQILRNTSDTINDPVNQPAVRAPVLADGTFGPEQPLPGTGYSYDRVNVYRAIQGVKAFVQGTAVVGSDLNNTIATATPTQPLNGANSINEFGNIGQDGAVQVGDNDIDLYKVTVQVTGSLTLSVQPVSGGTTFDPTLRVFDASGTQLYVMTGNGTGTAVISTPTGSPLATGTYYVGVSSTGNDTYDVTNATGIGGAFGGQGDYQLQVILSNPDPHGVPAAGQPLDLASPTTLSSVGGNNLPAVEISGVIGQDTDQTGAIFQIPNGDVKFFQLVAPDSGNVQATVASGGSAVVVAAFDSNYNSLGWGSGGTAFQVTAGQTYYLGVTSYINAGFDPTDPYTRLANSTSVPMPFSLVVSFNNGDVNGTVVQATPSTLGTPLTSQIGGIEAGAVLGGANGGYKDADFYSFVAPSPGVFHATVTGAGGFTPTMSLWSSTRSNLGVQRLADAPAAGTLQLYQQVTAGQVVVVAVTGLGNQDINGVSLGSGSGGQTGTYTLNTAIDPASELTTLSNNSIGNATPTPLALNTPIAANLGLDGNLEVGPNDIDMYSFTAPDTREYQFATNTNQDFSAQTVLRVFDPQGNQIAVNQASSSTNTNSVAEVPLSAGETVYVGVSGVGPNAYTYNPLNGGNTGIGITGPYSITATDAGPFQRTKTFLQGQTAKFTDANGHKITVTLNGPGTGQLIFQSASDGTNVSQIQLSGTDATSTLTIHGATPIPGLVDTGSMRAINAPQDDLTGDLSVSAGLGTLRLATASGGHSISVGTGGKLNLTVGTLTDVSLVSAEPVGTIRANQWTVTSSSRQQISAPLVQTLNVRGAFNEDVNVGVIGNFNVGSLSSSAIRVQSSIASISAGSAADSEIFVNVNPTLTTLPASAADFASEGGLLKNVRVRGAFSDTQIAAWDIGTVTLNALQPSNGGKTFGVAANRVSHLRVTPTGAKTVTLNNVFAPYAQTPLGSGDAVLRIVG